MGVLGRVVLDIRDDHARARVCTEYGDVGEGSFGQQRSAEEKDLLGRRERVRRVLTGQIWGRGIRGGVSEC